MKTKKIYTVIFCLGILVSPVMHAQIKSNELPKEVSSGWYKAAAENILKKEYAFTVTDKTDEYRAVNQENHLGFLINRNGFSVYNLKKSDQSQAWSADFTIAGAGRAGTQTSLPANFTIAEKIVDACFFAQSHLTLNI